jgi:gamma-glutamylcyclotransferase (GGCT)/AIG2-like uncharacterized protein YtfP
MTADYSYFAYGSNLDPKRKELRTGVIREALRAKLPGYRFVFNKLGTDGSGKANIVQDETSEVWGVVYRCSPKAMKILDRYEGAPDHYRRHTVHVILESGKEREAIAYIACPKYLREGLKPTPTYLNHILEGARKHNISPDYIRAIELLG